MLALDKLYKAISKSIPDDFPTKFGYINLSNVENEKTKLTENATVIYFRSANNPDRVLSGEYVVESQRVVFNIYSTRGEEGVLDGLDYCRRVCEKLDRLYNIDYVIDGECFTILNCKRLGSYQYIGPTEQGIQVFSITYIITFEGGN